MAPGHSLVIPKRHIEKISELKEEEIMSIFQKINQEGHTIIMITHEQDIAAHAKRIIHVKDGTIIGDDINHKQKKVIASKK